MTKNLLESHSQNSSALLYFLSAITVAIGLYQHKQFDYRSHSSSPDAPAAHQPVKDGASPTVVPANPEAEGGELAHIWYECYSSTRSLCTVK